MRSYLPWLWCLLALTTAMPAAADTVTHLWTVNMMNLGTEQSCDAVALGASGRPTYEIRFRRQKSVLRLIVSQDHPAFAKHQMVEVLLDGLSVGKFPAHHQKFGGKKAAIVNLEPQSVDFADLERHRLMRIVIGPDHFDMSFAPGERLADRMRICVRKVLGEVSGQDA